METKNLPVKISFIGDIMCEKPLLKASKCANGEYDFSKVFSCISKMFYESDYVVGNLETVCAGEESGYSNHIYCFNTPDEFINAIKNAGIDMVTTANNHCLDRGVNGLKRTLHLLDRNGIEHTGTYITLEDSKEIFVKEIGDRKIAFLSYTYGTNTQINGILLDKEEQFHVNLLKPQSSYKTGEEPSILKRAFFKVVFKLITVEQWIGLKRSLGMRYNKPSVDDYLDHIDVQYLEKIKNDIQKAKKQADHVIVCMHSGGQFNPEPGAFSKYMMDFFNKSGVDAVIGTHPHIVQECKYFDNGMLGIYSLGNFSISPSSVYVIPDYLPEYSIVLHLYINKEENNSILGRATFSIIKIVEDSNNYITVYPVTELVKLVQTEKEEEQLKRDVTFIYNRFLDKKSTNIEILDEYEIPMQS